MPLRFFIFSYILMPLMLVNPACRKSDVQSSSTSLPGQLTFSGVGFQHNGVYPKVCTCDSTGISPGLNWTNAPFGTKSFAVTMHHYPPTGDKHVYWVVYSIPASTLSIPTGISGVYNYGINTVNGKNLYTPPCSQGPGIKYYFLTLYALSEAPVINKPATQITMDVLRDAMKGKILDTAMMQVNYSR